MGRNWIFHFEFDENDKKEFLKKIWCFNKIISENERKKENKEIILILKKERITWFGKKNTIIQWRINISKNITIVVKKENLKT